MEQKTILLVEDDFLNRRLTKKVLLENNYAVLEAKNAGEALQILETSRVTLAILDIHLGENQQDGIELGRQIKNRYSVPFIYLTAYDNPNIVNKAVATTAFSYLCKPFKSIDLIASVEIAIRQSHKDQIYKISVKDGDYQVNLPTNEINYIESHGNYLLFHTDKKIFRSRATIKQILEDLSGRDFVQIHRAYVVNKLQIEKYNLKSVVVKSIEIPVSKSFVENLGL